MNTTEQTVMCACCLSTYSNLDSPVEFDRVSAWKLSQAMATIGQRNRGRTKHITPEESQRRRDQNYMSENVPDLLAALQKCEHVIGMARLQGKLDDNALSPVNDALVAARKALDNAS